MVLFENLLYIQNLHFKRLLWLQDGKMGCAGQKEKQENQLGVWVRKETAEVERSLSHILVACKIFLPLDCWNNYVLFIFVSSQCFVHSSHSLREVSSKSSEKRGRGLQEKIQGWALDLSSTICSLCSSLWGYCFLRPRCW